MADTPGCVSGRSPEERVGELAPRGNHPAQLRSRYPLPPWDIPPGYTVINPTSRPATCIRVQGESQTCRESAIRLASAFPNTRETARGSRPKLPHRNPPGHRRTIRPIGPTGLSRDDNSRRQGALGDSARDPAGTRLSNLQI